MPRLDNSGAGHSEVEDKWLLVTILLICLKLTIFRVILLLLTLYDIFS